MHSDTCYWKSGRAVLPELLEELGKGRWNEVNDEPGSDSVMVWYDTFDWRFWQHDMAVVRKENFFFLRDVNDWHEISRQCWHGKKAMRYSRELPPGDFRERFFAVAEDRALFRLVEITRKSSSSICMEPDSGPLYRLDAETYHVRDHKSSHCAGVMIKLRALSRRGEPLAEAEKILFQNGFCRIENRRMIGNYILAPFGRQVLDYSMKICTPLTGDTPCNEGVLLLLKDTFSLARRNERGIAGDADSEFLHDYRVALRRCRTLITAFRDRFDPTIFRNLQSGFKHMSNVTNRLRDCDVLLASRTRYLEMLPRELRPGLEVFFRRIELMRHHEFRHVRSFLTSEKYRVLCREILNNLDEPERMFRLGDASRIDVAAGTKIYNCYKKVLRGGRGLEADADDAAWHKVRIRCKKLRYLLEFFSGVFPEKVLTRVNDLKKLQTTLGDYNDMVVQIGTLQEKINGENCRLNSAAVAAIGGLIAILARDKDLLRNEFKTCFDDFASSENASFFKKNFR